MPFVLIILVGLSTLVAIALAVFVAVCFPEFSRFIFWALISARDAIPEKRRKKR